MHCSNCSSKTARAVTHAGVTSYLCANCRERLYGALAAHLRYAAIIRGLLHLRQ